MKRLGPLALALLLGGVLVQPALTQNATPPAQSGIGNAPNFLPLQDHTSLDTGEEVFVYWCWNCHGEGPGKPGTTALEALHKGEVPALLQEREDLDAEAVKFFVRNGTSIMPFFRPTQITDAQLDLLAEYLSGDGQ